VQDLSSLARDSMWPTSQEAGNMTSGRPAAMSAPGSTPVTPLPPAKDQGDPQVSASPGPVIRPGDDGKPKAKAGSWNPGAPAWGKTTTPDVVRDS
jgi:hypothetical protein